MTIKSGLDLIDACNELFEEGLPVPNSKEVVAIGSYCEWQAPESN